MEDKMSNPEATKRKCGCKSHWDGHKWYVVICAKHMNKIVRAFAKGN